MVPSGTASVVSQIPGVTWVMATFPGSHGPSAGIDPGMYTVSPGGVLAGTRTRHVTCTSGAGGPRSIQARIASWSSGVFGPVEASSTSWVPAVPYATVNVRLTAPTV